MATALLLGGAVFRLTLECRLSQYCPFWELFVSGELHCGAHAVSSTGKTCADTRRFSPGTGAKYMYCMLHFSPPLRWCCCPQDALAAFWAMRAQPGAPSDYLQAELMTELLQQV